MFRHTSIMFELHKCSTKEQF